MSGTDFNAVLGQASVKEAEEAIGSFFQYVDERLPSSQGWLFGIPQPTAADAHLVALLVRLQNVGRNGLLPAKIKAYADKSQATPEWQKVMGGLDTTMCPG